MKKWIVMTPELKVVHGFDTQEHESMSTELFHGRWAAAASLPDWYSPDLVVVDATAEPERPMPGWKRDRAAKAWRKPAPPQPDEAAARANRERLQKRQEDDAFLEKAADTLRTGGELSQSERDRVSVIRAQRGV